MAEAAHDGEEFPEIDTEQPVDTREADVVVVTTDSPGETGDTHWIRLVPNELEYVV